MKVAHTAEDVLVSTLNKYLTPDGSCRHLEKKLDGGVVKIHGSFECKGVEKYFHVHLSPDTDVDAWAKDASAQMRNLRG